MTQASDRAELDDVKAGLATAGVCDAGTRARGQGVVDLHTTNVYGD